MVIPSEEKKNTSEDYKIWRSLVTCNKFLSEASPEISHGPEVGSCVRGCDVTGLEGKGRKKKGIPVFCYDVL